MKTIRVTVHGCDDDTVVELKVFDREMVAIDYLVGMVNEASEHNCQPTMKVEVIDV